jgi:capsid portal protein
LTSVLETVTDEKKKRGELKAKRDLLFEKYLKHPMDTQLSLEIKSIDDQLAESNKPLKRTIKSSN